jgi:hypothetical protein
VDRLSIRHRRLTVYGAVYARRETLGQMRVGCTAKSFADQGVAPEGLAQLSVAAKALQQ